MSSKNKNFDPFASREAANYENPVPSREFILDYLSESSGPVTHEEICAALSLNNEEQIEAMRRRSVVLVLKMVLVLNMDSQKYFPHQIFLL